MSQGMSRATELLYNHLKCIVEEHPAAPELVCQPEELIEFTVQSVCKRGYSNIVVETGVDLWYNKENYARFKKEFDKELADLPKEQKSLCSITVPYVKAFGERWKFHRVEY